MRSLSYDVLPSMAMVLQTIDTSNNPDFTSILRVEDKIFSITHYESSRPGVAYLTELEQDKSTGKLTVPPPLPSLKCICQFVQGVCTAALARA